VAERPSLDGYKDKGGPQERATHGPVPVRGSSGPANPSGAREESGRPQVPRSSTEESGARVDRGFLTQVIPSWFISMAAHAVLILALALWVMPEAVSEVSQLIISEHNVEEVNEIEDVVEGEFEIGVGDIKPIVVPTDDEVQLNISPADDLKVAAASVEWVDLGLDQMPMNNMLATIGTHFGNDLSGRGKGNKARLAARYGGTPKSEQAVALALAWLAKHQLPDGSWSFNHLLVSRCKNRCRNPGLIGDNARIAATGMALLPFLGAGQTHKLGEYRKAVGRGLNYLVQRMRVGPHGGDLTDAGGRMYSHGIASIALCEAHAMTGDRKIMAAAQQAVNFICYAQDPVGGGWRYFPRQPGDTSVVGWQLMALKSGHMGYLKIPSGVAARVSGFLDSVQLDGGAGYSYMPSDVPRGPTSGDATTAIGLLCRMYLGWKKDNRSLERGVQFLEAEGPSDNIYRNYYATQVMRHWGGESWRKWNEVMRDRLVSSQARKGHEKGSWFFAASKAGKTDGRLNRPEDVGGRLYCTTMATMILEVYYRHLPIYRNTSTEEDFPID